MRSIQAGNRAPQTRLPAFVQRNWHAISVAAIVVLAAIAVLARVDSADSDQSVLPRATVTISAGETTRPVPRSYLGLSTEYWSLPLYASHAELLERVMAMLRVPGNGPLVLRIGGDSADRTLWDPTRRSVPHWAFAVTPAWTRLVSRLVRRLGARVILDMNLITSSAASAATWARIAESRLPQHSIIGFEVGNEPDIYRRKAWVAKIASRMLDGQPLAAAITAADYLNDFRSYGAALRSVAPGVPLLGPALANPRAHLSWVTRLVAARPPQLRTVTAHRYIYSGCVPSRSSRFPTIARLLSAKATTAIATALTGDIAEAHRAGLKLRVTELNSVNCGGRPGVSNAFVTALWAPQALFGLLGAGVDGVNIHTRADTINAPFAFTSRGLVARPLLYGLLMFARALGSDPQQVALRLHARPSLRLHAWAIKSGGSAINVLLVNDGRRAVRVDLKLPAHGNALLERLRAPSLRATRGVTLDGQWLGANGTWRGRPANLGVRQTRRGYLVTVPAAGATLVSAPLRSGALATELAPAG